jgi:SAM-dependent methyltransferase
VNYDARFFMDTKDLSRASALVVLPLVFEWVRPQSVIDVGCGVGAWTVVASEHGVSDVVGVDGNYVDRTQLMIPPDRFFPADLANRFEHPRRFDLAISVEVAEHLPQRRGASFVADLCRLADVVLFSAAIPRQGGVHHVNEQWQSHWAGHFIASGYCTFDIVRPRIWSDDRVAWWYRQNCFLAATGDSAAELARIDRPALLDCVHPMLWLREPIGVRARASHAPAAFRSSIVHRLKRFRKAGA